MVNVIRPCNWRRFNTDGPHCFPVNGKCRQIQHKYSEYTAIYVIIKSVISIILALLTMSLPALSGQVSTSVSTSLLDRGFKLWGLLPITFLYLNCGGSINQPNDTQNNKTWIKQIRPRKKVPKVLFLTKKILNLI